MLMASAQERMTQNGAFDVVVALMASERHAARMSRSWAAAHALAVLLVPVRSRHASVSADTFTRCPACPPSIRHGCPAHAALAQCQELKVARFRGFRGVLAGQC